MVEGGGGGATISLPTKPNSQVNTCSQVVIYVQHDICIADIMSVPRSGLQGPWLSFTNISVVYS